MGGCLKRTNKHLQRPKLFVEALITPPKADFDLPYVADTRGD